jgi:hypothetical protein
MGEYSGWMFWCGSVVRDGDLAGMDDAVVKMLARAGGSVDVLGSKFYDFR